MKKKRIEKDKKILKDFIKVTQAILFMRKLYSQNKLSLGLIYYNKQIDIQMVLTLILAKKRWGIVVSVYMIFGEIKSKTIV